LNGPDVKHSEIRRISNFQALQQPCSGNGDRVAAEARRQCREKTDPIFLKNGESVHSLRGIRDAVSFTLTEVESF
jgi:hypothetical protein